MAYFKKMEITMNNQHAYERFWDVDNRRVIDCQICGFIHLESIPAAQELNELYQQHYFNSVKPFDYQAVTDRFIEETLINVRYHQPYLDIYNRAADLLSLPSEMPLKMLDIGGGNDTLSVLFHLNGWDTCVIEPSKDAAEYLRKYKVTVFEKFADEIDTLDISDVSFVNMQFVLEHITNPSQLLQKIYRAMAPGGVIRICVPNDFSEGQLAYQEHYQEKVYWVAYPDHINYFSFSSLQQLLHNVGFTEAYRTTTFPLEFLLLGGINYYSNEQDQVKVGPFVRQFEEAFKLTGRQDQLHKVYEALAGVGMGRSITMYAVKR
jgi:SAM-dependent methyltransferase